MAKANAAKNEVAVKEENKGLAVVPENWGNDTIIPQAERLIPKLHLMQGMSQLVGEGKAKMGDIVDLVTGAVLGDEKSPVEIIPIKKLPSTWIVYDVVGNDREFEEIVEVSPENAKWTWEVKDAKGTVIRENDYCINFLVLAAKDPTFPYVVSFKRTSLKAGKKLNNHFDRCAVDKIAPARYTLKLTCTKAMNEKKQPYAVFDILPDKTKTSDENFAQAFKWYETFKGQEIKVDHRDIEEDAKSGGAKVQTDTSENSQY